MENFAGILSGRFWTIAVTGNFQLECPAVLKLQYALKLVNRPQAQEIIIAPATELGIFRTVGRYPFQVEKQLIVGFELNTRTQTIISFYIAYTQGVITPFVVLFEYGFTNTVLRNKRAFRDE